MELENKCGQPRQRDLANLRDWQSDPRCGKSSLLGTSEDVWDTMQSKGLSAGDYIAAADTGDARSYMLGRWVLRIRDKIGKITYHRQHDPGGKGQNCTEKQMPADVVESLDADQTMKVTNGVLTVVASTLPILPVVGLYLVKSLAIRVGLVFVFTMVMSAVTTFGLSINAEKTIAITTA